MGTLNAGVQGAEGVTFGNEHTSTRTHGERATKIICLSIPRDHDNGHDHS